MVRDHFRTYSNPMIPGEVLFRGIDPPCTRAKIFLAEKTSFQLFCRHQNSVERSKSFQQILCNKNKAMRTNERRQRTWRNFATFVPIWRGRIHKGKEETELQRQKDKTETLNVDEPTSTTTATSTMMTSYPHLSDYSLPLSFLVGSPSLSRSTTTTLRPSVSRHLTHWQKC